MTLPSWWKWEPAEMYSWDAPLGSASVVMDDQGSWCARAVPCDGQWCWCVNHDLAFVEGAKLYPAEAEARRACERVWMALERVKGEEAGSDGHAGEGYVRWPFYVTIVHADTMRELDGIQRLEFPNAEMRLRDRRIYIAPPGTSRRVLFCERYAGEDCDAVALTVPYGAQTTDSSTNRGTQRFRVLKGLPIEVTFIGAPRPTGPNELFEGMEHG